MTNEKSIKILSFITPGAGESCVKAWLTLSKTSILWGWFRQTQKDSIDDVPIDSYYKNSLYWSFSLPLLIFIYV